MRKIAAFIVVVMILATGYTARKIYLSSSELIKYGSTAEILPAEILISQSNNKVHLNFVGERDKFGVIELAIRERQGSNEFKASSIALDIQVNESEGTFKYFRSLGRITLDSSQPFIFGFPLQKESNGKEFRLVMIFKNPDTIAKFYSDHDIVLKGVYLTELNDILGNSNSLRNFVDGKISHLRTLYSFQEFIWEFVFPVIIIPLVIVFIFAGKKSFLEIDKIVYTLLRLCALIIMPSFFVTKEYSFRSRNSLYLEYFKNLVKLLRSAVLNIKLLYLKDIQTSTRLVLCIIWIIATMYHVSSVEILSTKSYIFWLIGYICFAVLLAVPSFIHYAMAAVMILACQISFFRETPGMAEKFAIFAYHYLFVGALSSVFLEQIWNYLRHGFSKVAHRSRTITTESY